MTRQTIRSVDAALSGTDALPRGPRGATVRCNTRETAPQRTPHAPDTAWGQPRARLGWSLRELAAATGINAGELSRIERGRSCPTPDQARRLLAAFDDASSGWSA